MVREAEIEHVVAIVEVNEFLFDLSKSKGSVNTRVKY